MDDFDRFMSRQRALWRAKRKGQKPTTAWGPLEDWLRRTSIQGARARASYPAHDDFILTAMLNYSSGDPTKNKRSVTRVTAGDHRNV